MKLSSTFVIKSPHNPFETVQQWRLSHWRRADMVIVNCRRQMAQKGIVLCQFGHLEVMEKERVQAAAAVGAIRIHFGTGLNPL